MEDARLSKRMRSCSTAKASVNAGSQLSNVPVKSCRGSVGIAIYSQRAIRILSSIGLQEERLSDDADRDGDYPSLLRWMTSSRDDGYPYSNQLQPNDKGALR